MSFTTDIAQRSSYRTVLVRLKPSRYVNDDLVSQGSGVYQTTLNLAIASVERNGSTLTKVSSVSSNDQWSHDESTGTFRVKLASAPNEDSNVIIVNYYLFYTSGAGVITFEDPEDDSTAKRLWEPRVVEPPRSRVSIKNAIAGVFTIDASSIQLTGSDDFAQYLGANDSFKDKDIEIWMCVSARPIQAQADLTGNVRKIYRGKTQSVSLSNGVVTIPYFDQFQKLTQPAYMGDTPEEAFFKRESGSFPSMDPNKSGLPVPYILGRQSRHKQVDFSYLWPDAAGVRLLTDCNQAVCINYSSTISTSTNRIWGLCRVGPGGLKHSSFGSIVRATVVGDFPQDVTYAFINSHNFEVGDHIRWTQSGTQREGIVLRVGGFTHSSNTYNIIIHTQGHTFNTSSVLVSTSEACVLVRTPGISVGEGGLQVLIPERDFTTTEETLSSGNKFIKITLKNNINMESVAGEPIDPNKHVLEYVVRTADDMGHADVLSTFAEKCGIPINSASFAAAQSALDVNTAFQIPQFDEQDYGTYLQYAELILEATLGYMYLNADLEAAYELVGVPSTGDEVDDHKLLRNTLSIDVQYQDIITGIIAYNPHNASQTAIEAASTPSISVYSNKAKYLHGIDKPIQFRHVLETIDGRIDAILALRSTRDATHRFATATEHLESSISDDLTIRTSGLIGGAETVNLKIVSLDKGVQNVRVEASDLKGLE